MRGQDGAESPECGIFQVSNCFHSFKLVFSQFQISFKIQLQNRMQDFGYSHTCTFEAFCKDGNVKIQGSEGMSCMIK